MKQPSKQRGKIHSFWPRFFFFKVNNDCEEVANKWNCVTSYCLKVTISVNNGQLMSESEELVGKSDQLEEKSNKWEGISEVSTWMWQSREKKVII